MDITLIIKAVKVFYKPIDYLIRFMYRHSINKYNHIPLETNIGGIKMPSFNGNCFIWESINR